MSSSLYLWRAWICCPLVSSRPLNERKISALCARSFSQRRAAAPEGALVVDAVHGDPRQGEERGAVADERELDRDAR